MKKLKKFIIGLIITGIVVGGSVFGLSILKKKNANKKEIAVYPVNEIGYDSSDMYYGDTSEIGGIVSVDFEQKVYVGPSKKVKEIKVKEGDKVKAGDVLMIYDMTSQDLSLETTRTEVEMAKTEVTVAQNELEKLKQIVPIEDMPPQENPQPQQPTGPVIGTPTDAQADEEGNIIPGEEAEDDEDYDDDEDYYDDEDYEDEGYTREELAHEIAEKQAEIAKLSIDYQLADADYQLALLESETGEVKANFNGVIKKLIDEESAASSNEPIMVVSGGSGYSVQSAIGELSMNKVKQGSEVSLFCYDNGMAYTGTVKSISPIPVEGGGYSQRAESFYPMIISIEDEGDLEPGMYVNVSDISSGEETTSGICLPLAFVKKDNKGYYVMKQAKGKLKKTYVKTGKLFYGDSIEVLTGLTYDDYIAFPYASDVEEGINTKEKSSSELEYY